MLKGPGPTEPRAGASKTADLTVYGNGCSQDRRLAPLSKDTQKRHQSNDVLNKHSYSACDVSSTVLNTFADNTCKRHQPGARKPILEMSK